MIIITIFIIIALIVISTSVIIITGCHVGPHHGHAITIFATIIIMSIFTVNRTQSSSFQVTGFCNTCQQSALGSSLTPSQWNRMPMMVFMMVFMNPIMMMVAVLAMVMVVA
eukprot:7525727-Karenia_brevis.AAC.1